MNKRGFLQKNINDMKKTICLTMLAALMAAGSVLANPVGQEQARRVGAAYLTALGHPDASRLALVETPFTGFYVFNAAQGGFVLVADDDCVYPIMGYSLTGTFRADQMPDNLKRWLEDCGRGIAEVKGEMAKSQAGGKCRPDDGMAAVWRDMALGTVPEPASLTAVSPLLTTTWNQSPLYNDMCPYDEDFGQRAVAGCVAIATAQIMKYWNHPAQGYGSHSYYAQNSHTDYGWLSADFGNTTYAWSQMPNALTSVSSQAQIDAVAQLVYHVGVALEMSYNVSAQGGSYAYNHSDYYPSSMSVLVDYFKYSPDMALIAPGSYENGAYSAVLRAELDQNRPILYDGRDESGGHSFVCDGYDQYGYFHFNWGWGGYCDGYYALGALNPAPGGTGGNATYTFNFSNSAILGIRPSSSFGTGGTVTVGTTGGGSGCSATGGGTYAFGDTVTLTAAASEGYRFAGWSDNSQQNARSFTMTGGNYSFNARFETLGSDTMSYCGDMGLTSSWGEYEEGFDKYWGIKLPASSLVPGRTLKAVDFFVGSYYNGYFDLTVYSGTTAPTDVVYSTSVWVGYEDRNDWYSIYLPTPYTVETGKSIWITFHNSDITFPAAITGSCGNPDGFLYGPQFAPDPEWTRFTYLIRGRFVNSGIIADGDTLSYCGHKRQVQTWSASEWGISIPAADLAGRNYLQSVKLYAVYSGIYTLRVYKGGADAPATLAHTQPARIGYSGWHEIALDHQVAIGPNDSLWITFSCPEVVWPAAACRYTGNPNSDWITWGGNYWEHAGAGYNESSWLIKAVTSVTAPTLPAPTVAISGNYYAAVGAPVTLTAAHSTGTTVTWNIPDVTPSSYTGDNVTVSWSTTGWHQVSATVSNANGQGYDEWWVNVVDCGQPVSVYPYQLGFEATDNMVCVNTLDANNDGYGWDTYIYDWYSGQRCYSSEAKVWNGNAYDTLAPNDWLFLPAMTTRQGAGYTMQWVDMPDWGTPTFAHYGVYIDTTAGTNPANYHLLAEYTLTETWWEDRSIDLSAYAGKTFRLAFRHYNSNSGTRLYLDDIMVDEIVSFFREGDTISYCGWRGVQSNLGYNSGTTRWGVKFTPARLAVCDSLRSVLLYVGSDGDYTLNVWQGGDNAPGNLERTMNTTFSGQYGWQEFTLNPAMPIDGSQPLWLTFISTAQHPAFYARSCGDPNSDWLSGDGINWAHASDYNFIGSWMIKAVTSTTEGCGGITLPYEADFTQCWSTTGGAAVLDSNHASINAQGQKLTGPWFEAPAGRCFMVWSFIRDYGDEYWWSEDSAVAVRVKLESESGETVYSTWDYSYDNQSTTSASFISDGGFYRLSFEYVSAQAAHLLHLTNVVVYHYPISITLDCPTTARIGDTVTIQALVSLPNGDTLDSRYWDLYYNNQWIDTYENPNGDSTITIISATDDTRTVVFHSVGQFGFYYNGYKDNAYGWNYAYEYAWKNITVFDSTTVDCNNISLPYSADFMQCWTAENGATIIDPNHAAINSSGQRIVGPWMESVPGKTFIQWSTQRDGSLNYDTERYIVSVESEDGVFASWWDYAGSWSSGQTITSPGGRIRISFEYAGTSSVSTFQISDLILYQYQIDIALEAPGIARVGDTVTLKAHITMQNGDTPDYYSWYMYDPNGNWIDGNDPALTILSLTDSTLTVVWNETGLYSVNFDIEKTNVYRGNPAYAYTGQYINIVNYPFYEEDSIYYASSAKETVIGCHPELHIANLPASVTTINDSAFFERYNLTTVNFPDALVHIGNHAFLGSYNIAEITIPRNVNYIGDNAFCAISALTTVNYNAVNCQTVSPTTESDGSYWPAFINCPNLATINIDQQVKRIPDRIFWGCYGLRGTLVIPDSVTYIGYDAFTGWNNSWAGGDDTLFIVIGSKVATIGNYAFGMPFGKLTTVVERRATPPTIYSNTFYVTANANLIVPCGAEPAYRAAAYWNEFQNIYENCRDGIEEVPESGVLVYSLDGAIVVSGAARQEVDFYDVSGRLLKHVATAGGAEVFRPSASGIYFVSTGSVTLRVAVVR